MSRHSRLALTVVWAGLSLFAVLGAGVMLISPGPGMTLLSAFVSLAILASLAVGRKIDLWRLIVPEWEKLDQHEKTRAGKAAVYALGWRRWIPFLAAPLCVAPWWLTYPSSLVVAFTGILLLPLLLLVIHRTPLGRACWAILAARGEPICTACGYNLTGNVSRRCPECGNQTYRADTAE